MAGLDGLTVGFIGLGLMGKPMARRLQAAGATLVVHNRSPGAVEELAAEGMTAAQSPRDVAARVGAGPIVLMLTDTPAVAAVLQGADGVLEALEPGALVVDMGTTAVSTTRELAAAVAAADADYVDAPVSGGQVGAEAGTLTIMAGGTADAFTRAAPLFEAMGQRITHVGEVGAGQVAKAANQVIVALTIGAVSEALVLARKAGVDPARVRDAIRGGFAESRILELHGERMVEGDFSPGGRSTVQLKDVNQALDLAASLGVRLPALETNRDLFEALIEAGHGGLDHSGLIKAVDPDWPVSKS